MKAQSKPNFATDDKSAAQRVFELEAQGIMDLAKSLDERFCEALDLMANVAGRVIVTGMGKSGHIVNKIAALPPPPVNVTLLPVITASLRLM